MKKVILNILAIKAANHSKNRARETEIYVKHGVGLKSLKMCRGNISLLITCTVVMFLTFSTTSCLSDNNKASSMYSSNNKLIGVWESETKDRDGIIDRLAFFADGRYYTDRFGSKEKVILRGTASSGVYSVNDNILLIDNRLCTFEVSGDILTLGAFGISDNGVIFIKVK
ncbi:MAG: hypothetical protein FWH18_04005 [Marinilabiliaceae bacterium]|nr:hypothetical protein [Marinilabiliaceae bacterium]